LIDGDIFLYRCGFACEKAKYLVESKNPPDYVEKIDYTHYDTAKAANEAAKADGGIVWTRREVEPVENALEATRQALSNVCTKFWPGNTWKGQIYLTGKGNFRDTIETDRGYKDNRDPTHRPKHYKAIKEYMVKNWGAKIVNGEEADDAIGRDAYSRNIDTYLIISNDKDLDQLSGYHYDWTKDFSYFVNDEDAIRFFYVQLLAGDTTDNIKGVVGLKRAKEIIEACNSPKDCALACKAAYEEKYGEYWGDYIEKTGELVWIRRNTLASNLKIHNPLWEHLHQE
jgi:hypothetical protein